jgi:hypothetical protein
VPGAVGEVVWGHREKVVPITVADSGNSLLVTSELEPSGAGTLLRLTETGFREKGREIVLKQQYHEHAVGWDTFLPDRQGRT